MDAKKKRLIITNLFIFSGLFVFISINKDYIRPAVAHLHFLKVLTGCLPNFLASFSISLLFVNSVIIKKSKRSRLVVYVVSILFFLILTFEEFVPLWGASVVFDKFDILASAIGSLSAIIVYEIIRFKQKSKT